jgi:hypothetical protein
MNQHHRRCRGEQNSFHDVCPQQKLENGFSVERNADATNGPAQRRRACDGSVTGKCGEKVSVKLAL